APQTDDLPVAVDVLQNAGGTPALPVSTPRAEDEDKNTSAIHANTGSIPHAEDEEEDAHRVEDFSHLYSLEVITEDDNFSQSDTLHPLPTGDAPSPPSPAAPPPLEGEACGRSGGTSSPAKETGSPAKNKKKLEVSAVPPQNCAPEAAAENRCGASSWKVLVSRLEAPLSMIMSLAEVASFSEQGVGLALPNTLEGMISACRLAEFEREVARFFRKDVRCQIRYVEMSGEVETLAAEKMRTEIQAREDAIARLRATPVMGAVLEAFHIDDPDGIRFTFNSK
ncbi:MAG: hypothetical protein FWC40_03785, partial [Proteobacteria bacterium]|nr:hypothetical protein [Pseudomonadota bacterium]